MFDTISAEIDEARERGFAFGDTRDAVDAIRGLEEARRKLAALAVEMQRELDRSQVFRDDGHASAKVMMRHVGRLSHAEAAAREKQAKMTHLLADVARAFAEGSLGVAHFDLLGRVHANPRVRGAMVDAQGWFLELARRHSYGDFELAVREWKRLADMDGAAQANARTHEHRNAAFTHNQFDLSWKMDGSFGSMQGATIDDIYSHYIAAERLTDWEKARAEHGDEADESHLPRTEQQRRADALWQVFQDAAAANGSAVPPDFCHDIVWSQVAYEEMLARLDGRPHRPIDPDEFECRTLDGVPLEPAEAAACSLVQKVRRVVVDAAGVVIDLGRARFFTGSSRKAVRLADPYCPWPGCRVAASHCEIDHSVDHADGGRTNPGNGGPFCGRHNRWKQKGFTVWRDPTGEWHVFRPDGTEIE